MARRNPPAKWVLPDVVDPPRICFQIEVPNEVHHLAAFRGAILNLAAAYKWQDDLAHTAKRVAAVWDDVYTKIRTCPPGESNNTGISLEDFMSQQIRISPDDACIIQMWCIDHWENWYDPRSCIPGTIEQPTNGTPLEPGDCREWDVSLRGNEKWLLPLEVDEGDLISITSATGAWNDGTLGWNCVDGHTYALGACVSADPAVSGDPLMTVDHMRLVASVATVFYDAYNTIIAVPVGVSAGQVFFQANDSTLTDNSGSVSFHVKVCKASVQYALTPIWGTGPAVVSPGQEFVWNSQANGGFYQITFSISPCAMALNLLSLTGWSLYTTGSVYGWHDCAHVLHGFNYPGTTSVPVPQTVDAEDYAIFSATPFSAVWRID